VVSAPAGGLRLTAEELAIWNDPGFRRRFAESYIAATDVEPGVTLVERETMEEVLDLLSAEKLDKAQRLLERERGDGASAVFDFTLGNIHFQQDRLDEAVAAYGIAVEKYPTFRRAWRNLALIHVREGSFEKAVDAFTRVLELGGGDGVTYGLLGYAYSSLEDPIAAESAYRMAVLLDPKTLDWKMHLALALFKQQRFADAAALCGKLIENHPERANLWLLQANAFIGLEKPLEAAENFELVDRLGESTFDSLTTLGDIYVNEKLFDLAVDAYARAIETDPDGGAGRPIRAAKVLTAHGAHAETRILLDAIETHRADRLETEERKEILKLRARIAMAEGAGEEEARILEEIVTLDPLDGDALILLGQYWSRMGETEKAIFHYERAASLEAFEADAKVRHAQLLVGESRYAEALPLLRRAQALKPRENVQEYLERVERVAQAR
jgi:tetratricopeptide (TPR) repeat protein